MAFINFTYEAEKQRFRELLCYTIWNSDNGRVMGQANTILGDPLLRRMATPLRARFFPIGFPLDIAANDPQVIAHAEAAYGIFADGPQENTPPLRLRVVSDPSATAGPPWPAHSFRAYRDLMSVVSGPQNLLTFDAERRTGAGFFSSALLDDPDYFIRTFLNCFTYMTLQRHHMTPFHAAGVVCHGQSFFFAGPTGAGKSSLVYFLATRGYDLLSDDASYLVGDEVRANPSRLHLRTEARDLFPELRDLPNTTRASGEEFIAVPARQLFPDRLITHAPLGHIVLLDRHADGAWYYENVSPEETHELLWKDCPTVDDEARMQHHCRMLRRVAANGAVRLRYSTFDQVLEFLERITASK